MENVDKIYDKFSKKKSYEVLERNPEFLKAREKAKIAAKELKDTLDKVPSLVKVYDDCISDMSCIAYREYYKQGYKFNRK